MVNQVFFPSEKQQQKRIVIVNKTERKRKKLKQGISGCKLAWLS